MGPDPHREAHRLGSQAVARPTACPIPRDAVTTGAYFSNSSPTATHWRLVPTGDDQCHRSSNRTTRVAQFAAMLRESAVALDAARLGLEPATGNARESRRAGSGVAAADAAWRRAKASVIGLYLQAMASFPRHMPDRMRTRG